MRFMCRVCCLLLSCVLCFGVFSAKFRIDASADILTVVDLTAEQTLALYGTSIQGSYFDGSNWRSVTFDYFAKSTDFTDSNNTYLTNIFNFDYLNYTSDQVVSLLRNNTFLFYRATMQDYDSLPYNSKIQFDIDFSVDISSISYYRQIIGFSRYVSSSGPGIYTYMPYIPDACVNSSVSYTSSSVTSILHGVQMSGSNPSGTVCAGFFCTQCSSNSSLGGYAVPFAFADVYLQDIDSSTGIEQTFAITGQSFSFNRAYYYYTESADSGGQPYYIIAISTPRVSDGYALPEPPTPEPDIPGQLIDIQTSIDGTNTQLALILAKLDQIYNVNIAPTINISSDSQSSLISSIVDGIRGLFVPSKAQLLAFRLNMENELYSSFPAFYSANTAINNQYGVFHNVSALNSVRFPGVSLDLPTGQGNQTANFNIAAQDVELKPASDRLGGLYDALAVIVDIICTLAVFNMLKKRFYSFFEGGASE